MGYTQNRSKFILVNVCWRKSGTGRDNKQFFTNEAALGAIAQIVENRLIRFNEKSSEVVNFQGPDRICGSCATFKLARLVEITDGEKGGDIFFLFTNRYRVRC